MLQNTSIYELFHSLLTACIETNLILKFFVFPLGVKERAKLCVLQESVMIDKMYKKLPTP